MIDSNTLFSTLKNFSEWYILFSVFVSAPVPTCLFIPHSCVAELNFCGSAPVPTCSQPTAVLVSCVSSGPLRLQHAHTPQPCCWAESLWVHSGSDMLTPHSSVAELSLFVSAPAPTCSHPTAMLLSWVSLSPLRLRHAHKLSWKYFQHNQAGGGGIETLSHQPLSSIDSLLSLLSRNFVLLDCWEIIGSSRLKTVVDYGSSRMKTVGKL